MNRKVTFRPEAGAEALGTRDWYEGRQPGLGARFRAALDETLGHIAESPLLYRRVRGETRRAILNRFPCAVYFRVMGDDIVVLAVHGRQHARRWQWRSLERLAGARRLLETNLETLRTKRAVPTGHSPK